MKIVVSGGRSGGQWIQHLAGIVKVAGWWGHQPVRDAGHEPEREALMA